MTYKNRVAIKSVFVAFLLTAWMAPAAFAQSAACDLTNLDCWGKGKKCNIQFDNDTGEGSGSGGGTGYKQVTKARTIRVSARKPDGGRAGKNSLSINAGQSNTLNLDKKNGFGYINIR